MPARPRTSARMTMSRRLLRLVLAMATVLVACTALAAVPSTADAGSGRIYVQGPPFDYSLPTTTDWVTSSPAGIACNPLRGLSWPYDDGCVYTFSPTDTVTLTAFDRNPGSYEFVRWTTCDQYTTVQSCPGSDPKTLPACPTAGGDAFTCVVTNPDDTLAYAVYQPPVPYFDLTLTLNGDGVVKAYPQNAAQTPANELFSCAGSCTQQVDRNFNLVLVPTPASTGNFLGWQGTACSSISGSQCSITMNAAKSMTADFSTVDKYTLEVEKKGVGQGTVTSDPAGINCSTAGSDCTETWFGTAQTVVLTATPADPGTRLTEWSSNCALISGQPPTKCQINVNALNGTRKVTATFGPYVTVSGTPVVGQPLVANPGTWPSNMSMMLTYAWLRCDAQGVNCAQVASGRTYTPTVNDLGKTMVARVSYTDPMDPSQSVTALSDPTAAVIGPPTNTVAPTITGTNEVGKTLTASDGTWTGSPTLTRQWQRCDTGGANCTNIPGATGTTHILTGDDEGKTMRVVVTGTNAAGSASATSAPSSAVTPASTPPAATTAPTISGTAEVGQALTANPGTWSGFPIPSFTYQWQRCDSSGANCVDVSGATNQAYTLTSADAGSTMKAKVTATNAAGQGAATTAASAVVTGPPVNDSPPLISGTTQVGQTLSAGTGAWTSSPTATYAYQWQRCDSSGANCQDISGATASTYALATADSGNTVVVKVTATNTVGSTVATSSPTATIAPEPTTAPVNTAAPTITGTTEVGQTLTADPGTWTANPSPTFTYQWQRCDSAGANCVDIAGAGSQTYQPGTADLGGKLTVKVTATNSAGSATEASAPTAAITGPPVNDSPPLISGTTQVGQTLSAGTGAWTSSPTATYAYQWQRCDSSGANCQDISGATASTYALATADSGNTVVVKVTATNTVGSTVATSSPTATIAPEPTTAPANTAGPRISGTEAEGQTLTADPGTWTANPSPTFTYQWQRCDSAGANCVSINGATGPTHTLTAADAGSKLKVTVTATNSVGTASADSGTTGIITGPPVNTAPPTIAGVIEAGATLTADPGAWDGHPAPTFSYQWQRCDSAGANCTNISGETGTTYTLTSTDTGGTTKVVVTATNSAGSADQASAPTALVAAQQAPTNTVAPSITGTTTVGQTLTAVDGTWTGSPTSFAYQWQRCDSTGANCSPIGGATGSTYTLTGADAGAKVVVTVTAVNAAGSAVADSSPTTTVAGPPVNVTPPAISGTGEVGATLTAGDGAWDGSPAPTFAYKWQRCDSSGANCADISGATSATYTLVSADQGNTVRAVVTATNTAGSATASATPSAVIAPQPTSAPINAAGPTISGTAQEGQTLTASPGTWSGFPTPTFAYQWQRCDASGANCTAITGATNQTYVLTGDDVAETIRVQVTATNTIGQGAASASPTARVTGAPVNVAPPSVSGTAQVGQSLAVTDGAWTGFPSPTFTYQWHRCSSTGTGCSPISGATSQTYTLTSADDGMKLLAVVDATNSAGTGNGQSSLTPLIAPEPTSAPVNSGPPTIAGTPALGQVLAATDGTWTGVPAPTFTRQWLRCDASGANCVAISGATGSTYTLGAADVGSTITVQVTATNSVGTGTSTAAPTAAVAGPPSNVGPPAITGTSQVGQTLSASPGAWKGFPTPSLAYQWQRCDSAGANCTNISGATASTYTLASADDGATLKVEVTGTNSAGSASAASGASAVVAPASFPVPATPPSISGTPEVGQVLAADPGTWTASPAPTFTYQWERCDAAGANCVAINGATAQTYTLTGDDEGLKLQVVVTATNPAGSPAATSTLTAPITSGASAASAPVNSVPPAITGPAQVGQALTATPGTWDATPAPAFTYQWLRCDSSGANCVAIAGATGGSYTLTGADVGYTIRVQVTAINSGGRANVTSGATAVVSTAAGAGQLPGAARLAVVVRSPRSVQAGTAFTVRVTTTNRGTDAAAAVRTCAVLPTGMVLVNRGGARTQGRSLCWSKASLAVGRSVSYRFRARALPGGTLRRTAMFRAVSASTSSAGAGAITRGMQRLVVRPAAKQDTVPVTG